MRTVLLISGWAHGAETLRPLAERIEAAGLRSLPLTADEALRRSRLPAADAAVGHSLGGMLLLREPPPGCRRLVLLASTARFCADPPAYRCGVVRRLLDRMIRRLEQDPAAVLEEFHRNAGTPPPLPPPPKPGQTDRLVEGLRFLRDADLRDRLKMISVPVLLFHGTADRIIPPDASRFLQAHLPDARLRLLDDLPHALPAFPEKIASSLLRFLENSAEP